MSRRVARKWHSGALRLAFLLEGELLVRGEDEPLRWVETPTPRDLNRLRLLPMVVALVPLVDSLLLLLLLLLQVVESNLVADPSRLDHHRNPVDPAIYRTPNTLIAQAVSGWIVSLHRMFLSLLPKRKVAFEQGTQVQRLLRARVIWVASRLSWWTMTLMKRKTNCFPSLRFPRGTEYTTLCACVRERVLLMWC